MDWEGVCIASSAGSCQRRLFGDSKVGIYKYWLGYETELTPLDNYGVYIKKLNFSAKEVSVWFWAFKDYAVNPNTSYSYKGCYLAVVHPSYVDFYNPVKVIRVPDLTLWTRFRVDFIYDAVNDVRKYAVYQWDEENEKWVFITEKIIGSGEPLADTIYIGIHNPGGWKVAIFLDDVRIYAP